VWLAVVDLRGLCDLQLNLGPRMQGEFAASKCALDRRGKALRASQPVWLGSWRATGDFGRVQSCANPYSGDRKSLLK
jgi:hypothetical protein